MFDAGWRLDFNRSKCAGARDDAGGWSSHARSASGTGELNVRYDQEATYVRGPNAQRRQQEKWGRKAHVAELAAPSGANTPARPSREQQAVAQAEETRISDMKNQAADLLQAAEELTAQADEKFALAAEADRAADAIEPIRADVKDAQARVDERFANRGADRVSDSDEQPPHELGPEDTAGEFRAGPVPHQPELIPCDEEGNDAAQVSFKRRGRGQRGGRNRKKWSATVSLFVTVPCAEQALVVPMCRQR